MGSNFRQGVRDSNCARRIPNIRDASFDRVGYQRVKVVEQAGHAYDMMPQAGRAEMG